MKKPDERETPLSSIPPYIHASRPPGLHASTPPYLHTSTHLSPAPYLKIREVKPETNFSRLSAAEKNEFEKLKTPKRRDEWLASRLAAKELISEALGGTPDGIEVFSDADRKPLARAGGKEFYISLSHRDALCACAINRALTPLIGVDVEKIEKRSEAWKKDFFTAGEYGACAGSEEKFTETWTLKEAALKMLGLGLSVDAREAEIAGERVKFAGRALERYEKLGSPAIRWKSVRKENYIISVLWA
ncbi:MAG: hypothetical protein COT17_03535 [Elusimicrobia bacterium CG08_land_8_20_14_0_20_51_18]|nr:MAG: hypothetical protein COT17_03535 [Elusimicrobia bacterium CG08_land_8_20_14_0_20_51_18]